MKNIVITFIGGTLITVFSTLVQQVQATLNDYTWYTGSTLSRSQFHDTNWYNNSFTKYKIQHKSQLTVSAFGGYQVKPYVAFEMGYNFLGNMKYISENQNSAFKSQGVQLSIKLDHPVNTNINAYARFGGMIWNANVTKSNDYNKYHDTGVSPVFAGGIEWGISHDIATRLEYQWINNIGDSNTVGIRPDNSMLNLGVSFRFRQQKKDPVITSNFKESSKHFATLESKVLFNFDKSIIKETAQHDLDHLYNTLNTIDQKNQSVLILGFTDRIGSDAYNRELSNRRAHSVANYLVSKGIHKSRIFAYGMGKSNYVTGNVCDKMKDRISLINCLSPDRRVEIKIKKEK